jgi:hypothetical protein
MANATTPIVHDGKRQASLTKDAAARATATNKRALATEVSEVAGSIPCSRVRAALKVATDGRFPSSETAWFTAR